MTDDSITITATLSAAHAQTLLALLSQIEDSTVSIYSLEDGHGINCDGPNVQTPVAAVAGALRAGLAARVRRLENRTSQGERR